MSEGRDEVGELRESLSSGRWRALLEPGAEALLVVALLDGAGWWDRATIGLYCALGHSAAMWMWARQEPLEAHARFMKCASRWVETATGERPSSETHGNVLRKVCESTLTLPALLEREHDSGNKSAAGLAKLWGELFVQNFGDEAHRRALAILASVAG